MVDTEDNAYVITKQHDINLHVTEAVVTLVVIVTAIGGMTLCHDNRLLL